MLMATGAVHGVKILNALNAFQDRNGTAAQNKIVRILGLNGAKTKMGIHGVKVVNAQPILVHQQNYGIATVKKNVQTLVAYGANNHP
jgi:hypothetical protein